MAGGCLGLGGWYGEQLRLRLQGLQLLCRILEMMMSEVRYSKATLPECCLKLGKRLEEPFAGAFLRVYGEMGKNEGRGFGEIFRGEMEDILERFPLRKEEKDLFWQFGEGLGYEEPRMQLDAMEQCRDGLKLLADRLEPETVEKGRMALRLGGMGGLLLVILLL